MHIKLDMDFIDYICDDDDDWYGSNIDLFTNQFLRRENISFHVHSHS